MPSTLETLPDELLIMIYTYMDPYHVLLAFLQLNERFKRILLNYKQDLRPSNMHYADVEQLYLDSFKLFQESVSLLTLDDAFAGGMQIEWFFEPIYPHFCPLHIRYCDQQQLIMDILKLIYMPELQTLDIDQIKYITSSFNMLEEEEKTKFNFLRIHCLLLLL